VSGIVLILNAALLASDQFGAPYRRIKMLRGRDAPGLAISEAWFLESAHQQQDEENNDQKAEAAAAVISGAVERSASNAAETAEQGDHKDDQDNGSDRHLESPPAGQSAPVALPSAGKTDGKFESSAI
jgi:hypothetical protein